jgi:hypothetical protein
MRLLYQATQLGLDRETIVAGEPNQHGARLIELTLELMN